MDSMAEILADYAKKQPDKLLVADYRGNEFSYAEAWLNVRRVAEFLAVKEGITQGQKILVDCCQDCYYFLADLACNLIGAVFIPVEENASLETIKSICDETGAVVFFTDKDNVRFMICIRFSEAFSPRISQTRLNKAFPASFIKAYPASMAEAKSLLPKAAGSECVPQKDWVQTRLLLVSLSKKRMASAVTTGGHSLYVRPARVFIIYSSFSPSSIPELLHEPVTQAYLKLHHFGTSHI